jgi:hypothetical protein
VSEPRAIVDRWMAAALALAGLAFAGFDALAVRPEMLSLARNGRRAAGTVVAAGGAVRSVVPRRTSLSIEVDDPELGPQRIDGSGGVEIGGRVEVLCSTPAGRCEPIAAVAAYERWPRTPGMVRAAALLGAAGVMAALARRRRAPG